MFCCLSVFAACFSAYMSSMIFPHHLLVETLFAQCCPSRSALLFHIPTMYDAAVIQRTYARRGACANVFAPRPLLSLQDMRVDVCILYSASASSPWCFALASLTSLAFLMVLGLIICNNVAQVSGLGAQTIASLSCLLSLFECGFARDVIGQCEMVAPPPM